MISEECIEVARERGEPLPAATGGREERDERAQPEAGAAAHQDSASTSPSVACDAPFQLRGSSFAMMLLRVLDPRHPEFFPMLAEKVRQAPGFFRNAPVVLDLESLPPDAELELQGFRSALREHGLAAVSLQGGTPRQQEGALAAGLALLPARHERPGPVPVAVPSPGTGPGPRAAAGRAPELPYQRSTRMVAEPVRSGRQIYAQHGDLVVCAPVSPGAELLADGSIHVYGALRGRALAGASGDTTARIFCQSLEAELVSIAGLYVVSEDLGRDVLRRQVQIQIRDGVLHVDPVAP